MSASSSSSARFSDVLVGYLAVPFEQGADILKKGYICSTVWDKRVPPTGHDYCHTSRKRVPFSPTREEAVQRMATYRTSVPYALLIEVRWEPANGEHAKNDLTQDEHFFGQELPILTKHQIKSDGIQLLDEWNQVLSNRYFGDGAVKTRDMSMVPCPFCNQLLETDKALADHGNIYRGQVGKSVYGTPAALIGIAGIETTVPFYMVSSCVRELCLRDMHARQLRLNNGERRKLYHATNRDSAELIRKGAGKFLRGSDVGSMGGGGVYFAHTARETWWKAEAGTIYGKGPVDWYVARHQPDWKSDMYAFLECEVLMGREFNGGREEFGMQFANLLHKDGGPYDSVILDREGTGYPVPAAPVKLTFKEKRYSTRSEDVNAGYADRPHRGYEFIVYSWDQIVSVRELPIDEIDPLPGL